MGSRVEQFLRRRRQQPGDDETQEVGIGGFTLFARVRDRSNLTAQGPTSPLEDGSFANDHIILSPFTVTIEGSVADVIRRPSPALAVVRRAQAEIGNVTSQFAPPRTQAQLSQVSALINDAADAVRRADAALDAGEQALRVLGNRDSESKPITEQFVDAMEALYYSRQLFEIDMPARRYDRMFITNLRIDRDNSGQLAFSLDVQQFEFTELQFVQITPAAGLGGQTEPEADQGTQEGEPAPRSLLFSIFGGGG